MANAYVAKKRVQHLASTLLGAALALFAACGSVPPADQSGSAAGPLEEVVVTGSRVERNRAGSMRPLTQERQAMSPAQAVAAAGADPAGEPAARTFAGMQAGGSTLLSQVQPGEELWVIQTVSAETVTEDTAPGSGTMLAIVARERGAPATEVPLPLRHTDVRAVVTGYISAVDVTQQFENPYDEKIEAVYVFPLPRTPPSTSS